MGLEFSVASSNVVRQSRCALTLPPHAQVKFAISCQEKGQMLRNGCGQYAKMTYTRLFTSSPGVPCATQPALTLPFALEEGGTPSRNHLIQAQEQLHPGSQ